MLCASEAVAGNSRGVSIDAHKANRVASAIVNVWRRSWVGLEERLSKSRGGHAAQAGAIRRRRHQVHFGPFDRLDARHLERRRKLPPKQGALGVGVAVVARIERHGRLSQIIPQAANRVFQHPPHWVVNGDDPQARIHDGQAIEQRLLPLAWPPARPGAGELGAGRGRDHAPHWIRQSLKQPHIRAVDRSMRRTS